MGGKTLTLEVFFLLVVFCYQVQSASKKLKTPEDLKNCMNKQYYGNDNIGMVKSYGCISKHLWQTAKEYYKPDIDNKTAAYITYLFGKYATDDNDDDEETGDGDEKRKKRQIIQTIPLPSRICIRKELRQLTTREYMDFIICIRRMKFEDRTLSPNLYEAIANIHNGQTAGPAHGGQAFLSWHTIYMLIMEFSLRECNPNVCLHYWDPRPDQRLERPSESNFYQYFGGTTGTLVAHFFGWGPNVVRNVGGIGRNTLFSYDDWNRILNGALDTTDISIHPSEPNSATVIEFPHNRIHNYLGGTLSGMSRAAHDPLFFLLHSFIEYCFGTALQRILNRSEYPRGPYVPGHEPQSNAINLEGIQFMNRSVQNQDGYHFLLRRHFVYEASPTCSNNCEPSRYFYCCNGECVAFARFSQQRICNNRKKRNTLPERNFEEEDGDFDKHVIQNDYAIDGVSDTSLWGYVGVNVLHYRSQNDRYDAFPVYNDTFDKTGDIYNPFVYHDVNNSVPRSNAKTYEDCKASKSGKGYVYVTSYGANYDGKYDEYVITDYRQAVSRSIAYMGIKKPTDNCSDVIFSAFDECGRLCQPYCPVMGSNPVRYEPCSGIVRIDNTEPRLYGNTLGDAVNMYWKLNDYIPHHTNIPYTLQFVCDGLPYVCE